MGTSAAYFLLFGFSLVRMHWLYFKFLQVFAEKNLIASFSYSSANSSSIPVLHTVQFFFFYFY